MTVMDVTATILPFPGKSAGNNRLLPRDKAEAYDWEEGALCFGYDRIVVYEQFGGPEPEESDFIMVYRVGHRWARWGAARQEQDILLWRCGNGVQAGVFASMRAALDALPPATEAYLQPPHPGRALFR